MLSQIILSSINSGMSLFDAIKGLKLFKLYVKIENLKNLECSHYNNKIRDNCLDYFTNFTLNFEQTRCTRDLHVGDRVLPARPNAEEKRRKKSPELRQVVSSGLASQVAGSGENDCLNLKVLAADISDAPSALLP